MKTSILKDIIYVIGAFSLVWLLFIYIDIFPDKSSMELSIENEEALGDLLMESLAKGDQNYKAIETSLVDSSLNILKKRLLENIGNTDYEYTILLVNNPQVNAITLPGGNILIFKGLIQASDSPEEVAAVLCHEIGHVERRHVVSKLAKEFGMTILFSILTGGDASIIIDVLSSSLSLEFDRQMEAEADDFGLRLMEKSSISPKYFASFFEKIRSKNYEMIDGMDIFSTHPNINSRIKKANEYKCKKKFIDKPISINWDNLKASLNE
ncbi:MAG: M48 family metallopeptidase [Vicingus serpentipes]|nr:M48 family metallopeptidase [Vicingus serpentipes]